MKEKIQIIFGTNVGKLVRVVSLFRKNGGQALPGLVVERLVPSFVTSMLKQLSEGTIIITGTNGKTTTTKMVVESLRANNKRIITNPTGSNMLRGIASSLARYATISAKLPYDIAVFEVDEAYAKQFIEKVKPRYVLALNVSRDQLDRFGEVDTIARLIGAVMHAATDGVVTNANDPHLSIIGEAIAAHKTVEVTYFGVSKDLLHFFPSDSELVSVDTQKENSIPETHHKLSVELMAFEDQQASYKIDDIEYKTNLQLTGQHNFQNAAAALALTKQLLPNTPVGALVTQLASISVAFGRGEMYTLKNGSTVQLVLVKNPASFRQGLASYLKGSPKIMIAINDNYADSRDVSWLWDIDFSVLKNETIALTTGTRAADMTLRLAYDDITIKHIEPMAGRALKTFCQLPGTKVIFATYTAMLFFHTALTKKAGSSL